MPEKSLLPIVLFSALALLSARWLPRWALRRPALVGTLTAALAAWGLLCLGALPVELMPNSASETISVTVSVRGGMNPRDVEALIARPLEETLSDLPRLKTLFVSARKDRCAVSLSFAPGADMRAAAAQTHERVERALPRLPAEIERPVIAHFEESDAPVYIAAVTSPSLPPEEIRRVVEERIKERLLAVEGVASVEVGGGRERKVLVELDRDRLLAYGLSVRRIASLLARRNIALQAGTVGGGKRLAPVRFAGTFRSVEEMRQVAAVQDPSGGTVLLGHLGTVKDSFLEPESLSRLNGRAAVSLYVQKESSANALKTARAVDKALERLWRELPPAAASRLERVTVSNQAVGIAAAMGSARMSLLSGTLLIMLVLAVFQGGNARPLTRPLSAAALALCLGAMSLASALGADPSLLEPAAVMLLAGFAAWAVFNPDLRPAFIVGGCMPLSALFCLVLFKLSGVTLNAMSLFGLALGMGMLVDNGIVVFEHLSARRPRDAEEAADAAEELVVPLIGATVTNAVVFVPFLFLSRRLQLMYNDVAAAVAAALFASLAVSLTVTALLTFRSVRGKDAAALPPAGLPSWGRAAGIAFSRLAAAARGAFPVFLSLARAAGARAAGRNPAVLAWGAAGAFALLWAAGFKSGAKSVFLAAAALVVGSGLALLRRYGALHEDIWRRRRGLLAAAGGLTLLAGWVLFRGTERDFQTSGELDEFVVFAELSSGAKLSAADAVVKEIEEKILAHPEAGPCVRTLVSRIEGWSSRIYVTLKPRARRNLSTEEVMARLRGALEGAGRTHDGGAFVHFSGARSGAEIAARAYGPDYAALEELAQKITAGMEGIRGLEDVKMRYRPGRPEAWALVDPDKAAAHGLSVEHVSDEVHSLLRGLRATTFRDRGSQVETIVRLRLEDRESLSALKDLPVSGPRGGQLRLGNVARLTLAKMPNEIHRENGQRFIEITANRARVSLSRAGEETRKVLEGIRFPLDYHGALEGDYEDMTRGLRQLGWGLLAMAVLVYLTLVLLFESLLQPLIIMTTVPLCVVGAAWGLTAFRLPLTTGALVGMMMLGGVAVNNAIMLLDRFNARGGREARDPARTARLLFEAARDRLRPILLTAGSAVLGFLPMTLDGSESGALWRPLSVTMVSGLLVSTVLTLYIVPCAAYALMHDVPALLRALRPRRRPAAGGPEASRAHG